MWAVIRGVRGGQSAFLLVGRGAPVPAIPVAGPSAVGPREQGRAYTH